MRTTSSVWRSTAFVAETVRAFGMAALRGKTTCIRPPACSIPIAMGITSRSWSFRSEFSWSDQA